MSLYHLTPPFYETRYHLFTPIIFSTVSLLFKYWFWFNHRNRSDYYCKVVLKIFRISIIVTWNLRNITQWLEITQNVNTCVASNARRDILNQIFYVVRRKMCFHLFLLFEPIVYPTTCVWCVTTSTIIDKKGVSACICALLSLSLWHIVEFNK